MAGRLLDPRIKLRHIACFLEVARFKSVVTAAEALHISQPAASKTIQELEQVLGADLFDRSRRKLILTPFGEVFHRYAATSVDALRQGVEAASGRHEVTTVKVGALPTVSARMLPEAVRLFTADNPGVHARVVTGPNDYLLSLLRTGDFDLAFLDVNLGADNPSGLDALRWLRERGYPGKTVFLTGHGVENPLVEEARSTSGVEVLQKPISMRRLARALARGRPCP